MRLRIIRNRILSAVSITVVAVALVGLWLTGQAAAFNIVLGVAAGAIATTVPQALSRHADQLLRARAAARLVRSDLYARRRWVQRSLKDDEWMPPPSQMASAENYASLAYMMPSWRKWEPVSKATRYIAQLVGEAETHSPEERKAFARDTINAINTCLDALDILDGRPKPKRERGAKGGG